MRARLLFAAALGAAMGFGVAAAFAGTPGYYLSGEGGISLPPDLHLDSAAGGLQHDSFGTRLRGGAARSVTTPAMAGASNSIRSTSTPMWTS